MEKRTPPLELIFSVLTRVEANRRVTRSEVRELHNALLSTKEELLDPSTGYGGGKNAAHRHNLTTNNEVVIEGERLTLNKSDTEVILKLSDELNINEYECFGLLRSTYAQYPGQAVPPDELLTTAISIYFGLREYALQDLLLLFKGRLSRFDAEVHSEIVAITEELLEKGLPSNLIALIQKNLPHLQGDDTPRDIPHERAVLIRQNKTKECTLMVSILLAIFYQTEATPKQLLELLQLFKKISEAFKRATTDLDIFSMMYKVLVIIINCLNLDRLAGDETDLHVSPGGARLSALEKSPRGIDEINQEIAQPWANAGAQAAVALAWAWFLTVFIRKHGESDVANKRRVSEAWRKAKRQGSFNFFVGILQHRHFKSDMEETYMVQVIHTMLVSVLSNLLERIETMREKEEILLRNRLLNRQAGSIRPDFEDLMRFCAALYKGREALCLKFWDCSYDTRSLAHFVRFAADAMNPQYFVHYINMLAALSSGARPATQTFTNLAAAAPQIVSWDHFFRVLGNYAEDYHRSMQNIRGATVKMLSVDDENGLVAILNLTKQVAICSETARMSMVEHAQWNVIENLFNLVICPIPHTLKAKIYSTLAAFAASPNGAEMVWRHLEARRILSTAGDAQGEDIRNELEGAESSVQEYPEIIAFMKMLQMVIRNCPLVALAPRHSGGRGFGPYLAFILENVFLRFDSRGYMRPNEKWKVANAALKIFHELANTYEPDELQIMEDNAASPKALQLPSGFLLLQSFLGGRVEPLRKVLSIIQTAAGKLLSDAESSEEFDYIERAMILSLKLLNRMLVVEEQFVQAYRAATTLLPPHQRVQLTPLTEALVNDYAVSIARCVSYDRNLKLPYFSVNIIRMLSKRSGKLVPSFDLIAQDIMDGYVERLESQEEVSEQEADQEIPKDLDPVIKRGCFSVKIKKAILTLLLENLNSPPVNMTHFLLGFDPQMPLEQTDLNKSGRTVLHVILEQLRDRDFAQLYPGLCEDCYRLIYELCANRRTHRPIFRFLNNREQDFFYEQLRMLATRFSKDATIYRSELKQRSWLLKTVALELHVSSGRNRMNTHRLLTILYATPQSLQGGVDDEENDEPFSMDQEADSRKILALMSSLDLTLEQPKKLASSLFDVTKIEAECRRPYEYNTEYYDIDSVNQILLMQKRQREAEYAIQSDQLALEAERILREVVDLNAFSDRLVSLLKYFEAWRQLTEVSLARCYESIRQIAGEDVLYDLLDILLTKLANEKDCRLAVAEKMSLVVVFALTKLREQHRGASPEDRRRYLPTEHLQEILQGLVKAALRRDSSVLLRGNIYGALLNYLQFTRPPPQSLVAHDNSMVQSYSEQLEGQQELDKRNFAILESAGVRLIETIASDAAHSLNLWRSLAFSLLDVLIGDDHNNKRLAHLSQKGFIRHCLDAFNQEQDTMSFIFSADDAALREAIVFDSELSMLLRMVQTPAGAQLLLENGILQRLTECRWIDQRPDYATLQDEENNWAPGLSERYHNFLESILRIVVSLLVALPQNLAVAGKVLDFVSAHADLLAAILKDTAVNKPLVLNEIRLVTEMFYHLVANAQSLLVQKLQQNAMRFHHALLNLFVTLTSREISWNQGRFSYQMEEPRRASVPLVHEINRNVIAYCRILCDAAAANGTQGLPSILFTPNLSANGRETALGLTAKAKAPPLSLVLEYLKHVLQQYDEAQEDFQNALDKHQRSAALATEEILEILAAAGDMVEEMSPQQRLILAQNRLSEKILSKRKETLTLRYMLENLLVLVWRHLAHYTRSYGPSLLLELPSPGAASRAAVPMSKVESGVTLSKAEIEALKSDAKNAIQDTLNRLQDFNPDDEPKGATFYYLTVKKIKELIRSD